MMAIVAAQLIALTSGACMEGTKSKCSLAGCDLAYRYCEYPGFGPCECVRPTTTTQTLRTDGKYLVAGVWYAVPGPGSSTVYAQQTQTGTTTTTTNTHANTASIGISNQASFLGLAGGAYDVSFTNRWSSSSSNRIDEILTYVSDHTMPGPGLEVIDHNYDQIVLLLKPELVFTGSFQYGSLTSLRWAIDNSRAILYPVEMGWLNGAWGPMPSNIANDLYTWGGITAADFPQIIAANPYAYDPDGVGVPQTDRYECVETLYYQPGQPNIEGWQLSNTYSSADTRTTSHEYSVRLALSGTWLFQKLNASDTWTWSNSSSTTNSTSSTATMRVNLRQPSETYTGTTLVFVYVDKIYKTLLYSFSPPPVPNAFCW